MKTYFVATREPFWHLL